MNKLFVICIITSMLISSSVTSYGAVDGITSENYSDYEKPIADEYGYNKGECEKEYREGEEQFYNECYDHWNVDKVYDTALVEPTTTEPTTTEPTKAEPTKATTPKSQKPKAKSKKAQKPKAKSDKAIAKEWAKAHGGNFKIKKLVTISKGGKRGKVKGTKYIVKYPKKVKKGKRVVCYMIEKNGNVEAMVCCGKVK